MKYLFSIGSFSFSLNSPDTITPPDNFMKFAVEEAEPEMHYQLLLTEQLPHINTKPDIETEAKKFITKCNYTETEGRILACRPDMTVYQTNLGECRRIGIKGRQECYGFYRELSSSSAEIFLKSDQMTDLNIDPVFTSLLALERQMLRHNSLILHCAYLRYQGEALLFSAPSGIGKTTQANLWKKYMGSTTINGDRCLLRQKDGRWIASGWPVCGTSEICLNEDTPIRAIIVLKQAAENIIRKLSAFEAFTQLYAQITVNSWNRRAVDQSMQILERIVTEIPVYELSCTISRDAVECLAAEL